MKPILLSIGHCVKRCVSSNASYVAACFLIALPIQLHGQQDTSQESVQKNTSKENAETKTADTAGLSDKQSLDPVVARIIEVGSDDNHVQDHLDFITNRIGPRLTGSEGLQFACEWAKENFERMGLKNCRLEQWGEVPVGFERGPSLGRMVEPENMTLTFGTNAWTAGTKGRTLGEVMICPKTPAELETVKDQVAGKFVLVERVARQRFRRQQTEDSKKAESKTDESDSQKSSESTESDNQPTPEERMAVREALEKLQPAGIIQSTSDELILTGGSFQVDWDNLPTIPRITLQKEQYDEIKDLAEKGQTVKLMFDIRNHFRKGPIPLYNVIADIPGTEKPDEYVVVGGHLDSWDGATGATDNAAGCATTIEAARILMAAGVKPKRTIRFMLWSGEEQGLLGSRGYVEKNPDEVQRISSVFVHDGGTNYVAGIRCTEAMRADFDKVFAPILDLDENAPFEVRTTTSMRPQGGSDHVPFIRAGVPGFFWDQRGRATYRTTHHTQYDTFESIVPEYQKHSSIVIAVGAYGVANLENLISREGIDSGR